MLKQRLFLVKVIEKGVELKDKIIYFFDVKKEVIDNAKTQIEEIKGFLTKETITKLDTFINNHKKVVEVIKTDHRRLYKKCFKTI